jgi:hypothetical protein
VYSQWVLDIYRKEEGVAKFGCGVGKSQREWVNFLMVWD